MTNPTPVAAPFVVVPTPGQPALAVALNRPVRDRFGRELLAGMTCGFTVESAVSLVVAGWGLAHCFNEEAAETWAKALRPHFEGVPMEQVLQRFTGPFIEVLRKERAAELAQLESDERARAEAKLTADAQAAAQKLADDQLAAEAASRAKLEQEVREQEAAAVAAGVEPVQTAPVVAETTVSSPTADSETLQQPEPQPTPPPAPSASKRGNKSPR